VTNVLVVAPSAVVRAGLVSILEGGDGLAVVGSAPYGSLVVQELERLQPDVVLVELDGGTDTEGSALSALGHDGGPPVLVVLADEPIEDGLAETLRLGARAVLPRDAQPEEIVAAVKAAAAGLVALHPDLVESLLSLVPVRSRPARAAGTETLTPREIEVLGMLAEGAGNKQIARRLGISEHTIKFHVGSILAKLGAASRTEAVTLGVRQGLIMV
jgi:NarL family two-component system response regulator YdfI